MDARGELCISIGGTEGVCEDEIGCTGGSPCRRVAGCPAFFIGSDGSGSDCCSASSILGDESDTESCHGVTHCTQSIASSDANRFRFPTYHNKDGLNRSTTVSTECPSAEKTPKMESKQPELAQFEGTDIRELLTRLTCQHETDMLSVRQELRSLGDAVDCERRERMTAFQQSEVLFENVACALEKERSQRLSEFGRLSQECSQHLSEFGCRSCVTDMHLLEASRTCITSISELSCTLEKESRERVALEVSVYEAFQVMQGEFEQEVAQREHLVKDLKHSWDEDLTFIKEKRCEEQEQLAGRMKEIRTAVERESRDRIHAFEHMRGYIDGACQRIDDEAATLSQALKIEEKQREDAGEDIRQQFDEVRMQLDQILAEFYAKLFKVSKPLAYSFSPFSGSRSSPCTPRSTSPRSPSTTCIMHPEANVEL